MDQLGTEVREELLDPLELLDLLAQLERQVLLAFRVLLEVEVAEA